MTATRTRKQSTPDVGTTPKAPAEGTPTEAPQPNLCRCGCGQPTKRTDARYVSGHDARHAGALGRELAEGKTSEVEIRQILDGAPKLIAKALGVAATAARKAAEKEARRVAREAAAEAAKQVLASAGF